MEFVAFLIIFWVIVTVIRRTAKPASQAARIVLPPDFFGTHAISPEHVRRLGGEPGMVSAPAMISAPRMGEESSSEGLLDETAADHDTDLKHAEVVSLELASPGMSVAPRPLPVPALTLETEVDWEAEHQRFHKRYVDARAPGLPAAHGLLDELRDPASARRAVLMAEILGPPVSLRGDR